MGEARSKRVAVDASLMVTVGPEDPAWQDPLKLVDVDGAFVRIDPPLNCPDEEVQRMRVHVQENGAVAVKVLPTRRDEPVPSDRRAEVPEQHATARVVVGQLLLSSRSNDKVRLAMVLEGAMNAEGV